VRPFLACEVPLVAIRGLIYWPRETNETIPNVDDAGTNLSTLPIASLFRSRPTDVNRLWEMRKSDKIPNSCPRISLLHCCGGHPVGMSPALAGGSRGTDLVGTSIRVRMLRRPASPQVANHHSCQQPLPRFIFENFNPTPELINSLSEIDSKPNPEPYTLNPAPEP
jgi:hypothetical protein